MMKIIHFTKNRPLQYRAFLESFLYNTNIRWGKKYISDLGDTYLGPITVIGSQLDLYKDIMEEFTGVNFLNDQGKYYDHILRDEINATFDNYILLGCDDEVVINKVEYEKAIQYLDSNPDCIGFSLRLGNNIPEIQKYPYYRIDEEVVKWQWRGLAPHMGYSFDVMATIYPTWLVQEAIKAQPEMKTPNFTEAWCEQYCAKNRHLPSYMACFNQPSSFIAQDVNRTQSDFPNRIQATKDLSCEVLNAMYKQGFRIDWQSMQGIVVDDIFVGDKYLKFININDSR